MIRTSIKTKIKMTRTETVSVEIHGGLPANRPRPSDDERGQSKDVLLQTRPLNEVSEREK